MTLPIDFTSIDSVLNWLFHTGDIVLFGNAGYMIVFLLIMIFALLMLFNANKFTAFGFMSSLLLAMGIYGYQIVGWIAPAGAMIAGLLLGIAFIKVFSI